jgi:molybdopterin molybdotransferase
MSGPERINAPGCAATIEFDIAQAILAAHALPLGTEHIPLDAAAGRPLAAPVVARIDSPRRDCAAMDGYALRSADLENQMLLRIAGARYAGAWEGGSIGPGEAMRVMTGAPLPEGADRVVMIERCEVTGDRVRARPDPGERAHVRPRAGDFARGAPLLQSNTRLDPFALVSAAAADVGVVTVWRQPRVRIVATGDEIAVPGKAKASPYLIPDSLSLALTAFCTQWGAAEVEHVRVPDESEAVISTARAALGKSDLLILVGGAARGDRDHCRAALKTLGLHLVFADLAIKPGKPVWFGRLGNLLVLGLPGNPTAALTIARLFLAPLLAGLGGAGPASALQWVQLPVSAPVASNGPREAFLCGTTERGGAFIFQGQEASGQALLARTGLLVRRPSYAPALAAGESVSTLALRDGDIMAVLAAIIEAATSRRLASNKAEARVR